MPRLAAHRAEIDGDRRRPRRADLRQHHRARWSAAGARSTASSNLFWVLAGADTSDAIEAVEREVSPLLARHANAMYLNRALYARIADLYARREALGLTPEQARVLERYHTRFVRAGGALDKPAQDRLADHQRAAGEPRHPVRAERAGRREGLRADAGGGRSRRAARFRPRRRARRGRRSAGRPANTPLRWRARPARPSCSFPRAATCARRCSRPGSGAARTAARPTTAPSSPRRSRLRAERAKLLGLSNLRRLPARRPDGQDAGRRAQAAGRRLEPRACQGRRRARRAAGA